MIKMPFDLNVAMHCNFFHPQGPWWLLFGGRKSNMTLERVIFANDPIGWMLLLDKLYIFHYEEWWVFNATLTYKAYIACIVLRDKQVANITTP